MTETEKMAVLSALNKRSAGTLMDLLGIEFIDVGDNFLTVKMTITPQTHLKKRKPITRSVMIVLFFKSTSASQFF